ncbi:MAG: hypothetical protein FJ143_01860, partial [Deltaproteobacteria bacterium]|nr:hypothetical protein [Deltaproteobacteria bacterium]
MRTILGPFHPDLEDALVDEILRYKEADLFCPLLIVVPSDLLRRRLKILLGRERRLALLNVQVLTFYQLALRLYGENSGAELEMRGDLFLEEAVRQMIRTGQPGAERFATIENRAGGCAALWQTLRDLRDGLVEPAVALEALREGHFSQRASARTSELLRLLVTLQQFCRDQTIADQSDLFRAATERVAGARFVKSFAQIFYYGFYDLTQIQSDFFHAVARHYPTTLFFPFAPTHPPHAAWQFAARFYERYVQGLNSETVIAPQASLPPHGRLFDESERSEYRAYAKHWHCKIVSSFGMEDEVAAAAKEILRLVDDDKYRFDEIAVVARSLDNYGAAIQRILADHFIPTAGVFETPLVELP